jgi:hypothetical protein|tara:strand:+ start:981 stop:1424 length:444 start_codon:yes stop_codon:yes gene_type:complete
MTNNLTRHGSASSNTAVETINFNASADSVITNVIYTTTNALGVQEKPFEGPDIIHDLGVSDILVFVTGYMLTTNTSNITTLRNWVLESKVHTSYPYGRFGVAMDIDIFNKVPTSTKGYMLYDAQFTEEADPHRVGFTLKYRFSGTAW